MNVTTFPIEERERLFNKWLKDREVNKLEVRSLDDPYQIYLTFGHDVDISKNDLENPNFKMPEWDKIPEWVIDLAPKIGCKCNSMGTTGILIGFTASYEDFYYRIQQGDRVIKASCVGPIEFDDEKEETK